MTGQTCPVEPRGGIPVALSSPFPCQQAFSHRHVQLVTLLTKRRRPPLIQCPLQQAASLGSLMGASAAILSGVGGSHPSGGATGWQAVGSARGQQIMK